MLDSTSRDKNEQAVHGALNSAPPELHLTGDLPRGLFDFLRPLHRECTPRQQQLIAKRKEVLAREHGGRLTQQLITRIFDEELDRILRELCFMKDLGTPESFRQAREIGEATIARGELDPV